jgi:hypothetical protein
MKDFRNLPTVYLVMRHHLYFTNESGQLYGLSFTILCPVTSPRKSNSFRYDGKMYLEVYSKLQREDGASEEFREG